MESPCRVVFYQDNIEITFSSPPGLDVVRKLRDYGFRQDPGTDWRDVWIAVESTENISLASYILKSFIPAHPDIC